MATEALTGVARPTGDGTANGSGPSTVQAPHGGGGAGTQAPGRWEQVLSQLSAVAGVIAPTTVLTALLYYYGYVATYARFDYFGIDLATLRLSTQELVMRSAAVLYVPCAVVLGLSIGYLMARNWTRAALGVQRPSPRLRTLGWAAVAVGVALLVRAAVGIAVPRLAETEYPATTPACLGAGAVALYYGRHLLRHVERARRRRLGQRPARRQPAPEGAVVLLLIGVVVLSLFWAANTFAAAYGRGQAQADSRSLTDRPAVTLDTREQLHLNTTCAEARTLPEDEDQSFRYRHRGLRLLAVGSDRLFLIPEAWQQGCDVLVVPDDDSVRLQFGP